MMSLYSCLRHWGPQRSFGSRKIEVKATVIIAAIAGLLFCFFRFLLFFVYAVIFLTNKVEYIILYSTYLQSFNFRSSALPQISFDETKSYLQSPTQPLTHPSSSI